MQDTAVVDPERLITPKEASDLLRCSVDYVWHLCRKGELAHLRKGNRILVRRQDLTDYIAGQIRGG